LILFTLQETSCFENIRFYPEFDLFFSQNFPQKTTIIEKNPVYKKRLEMRK
jgi:hypothetical protein